MGLSVSLFEKIMAAGVQVGAALKPYPLPFSPNPNPTVALASTRRMRERRSHGLLASVNTSQQVYATVQQSASV